MVKVSIPPPIVLEGNRADGGSFVVGRDEHSTPPIRLPHRKGICEGAAPAGELENFCGLSSAKHQECDALISAVLRAIQHWLK